MKPFFISSYLKCYVIVLGEAHRQMLPRSGPPRNKLDLHVKRVGCVRGWCKECELFACRGVQDWPNYGEWNPSKNGVITQYDFHQGSFKFSPQLMLVANITIFDSTSLYVFRYIVFFNMFGEGIYRFKMSIFNFKR